MGEKVPEQESPIYLKISLHTHLRVNNESKKMLRQYARQNVDAVLASDHVRKNPEANFVYDYSKERKIARELGIILIDGAELSAGHHVGLYKAGDVQIKVVNHPMRYWKEIDPMIRFADKVGTELIETTNHARMFGRSPNIDEATANGLMPVVSDDAHKAKGADGNSTLIVDAKARSGEACLKAIQRGDYAVQVGRRW